MVKASQFPAWTNAEEHLNSWESTMNYKRHKVPGVRGQWYENGSYHRANGPAVEMDLEKSRIIQSTEKVCPSNYILVKS